MTAFARAIAICGLSQTEAADLLKVRPDTIKSWCSGRRTVPAGAWQCLGELHAKMCVSRDACLALIAERKPEEIEFNYSGQQGRWPSVGCADAVEAMVRLGLKA